MAGPNDFAEPPQLPEIARSIAAEILNPTNLGKLQATLENANLETMKSATEFAGGGAEWAIEAMAGAILRVLNAPGPIYNAIARAAIDSLLSGGGGGGAAGGDAGQRLLNRIAGNQTSAEPGISGAANYLTLFLNEEMEAWARGVAVELVTEMFPRLMPLGGGIETFAKLEDIISDALGGGRMVRRVLQPFINATAITPATWHVNKAYRQELLSPAEAVRQFHRGNLDAQQLDEELGRQGYNADRIKALVNAGKKFFSAGDVRTFVDRDHWDRDRGLQHLRDQGYDEDTANDALRLEGIKRIEQLEASEGAAITAAYVDRRIDGGEFGALMRVSVKNDSERALLEELAEVRRALNVQHLSPAEAKACVKAGILAVVDYRRALERAGYTRDAVIALELLLRHELDEKREIEELRREQAEERAREKAEREAAAARRRAEIEAERERRRRGPIGALERAVARGLIPFSRLEEVLAAEYDPDTVEIFRAAVEADRVAYLERLDAAEEARKRGTRRQVDVGSLERAVLANVLTVEEFERRLIQLHFDEADAALLAGVVRARKADQDAAEAKRREADDRASRRRIDLGRFERLVRRGVRSMAEYDALLADLDFEDADRAAMIELLNLQIADDRKADAERKAAESRLVPRGLSLEQYRRAVILGIRTIDQLQAFLVEQRFTADAQSVILAEVRAAVAEAEDARRRREQEPPRTGIRGLPLSTLQRAARLGIITPDTYAKRLTALGYTEDDLAIETELLLIEIAETQRARERRRAAELDAVARGLSLEQVARAVRAGAQTVEDYRAAAIAAGLDAAAVDILVAVLTQEVGTLTEARAVRAEVLRELAAQNISLEELERAVTKGGASFASFVGELRARGIGADEAELVAALLVDQMETPTVS